MVFALGTVTSLWATKIALILTVIVAAYWAYRATCVLLNPTICIPENGREIVKFRTALGFVFNKVTLPVSDYYGIRNRVHWGHYKHCQTELVGASGKYLPIRVELMSEKISADAVKFKSYFAKELNLENRPDIEHA